MSASGFLNEGKEVADAKPEDAARLVEGWEQHSAAMRLEELP